MNLRNNLLPSVLLSLGLVLPSLERATADEPVLPMPSKPTASMVQPSPLFEEKISAEALKQRDPVLMIQSICKDLSIPYPNEINQVFEDIEKKAVAELKTYGMENIKKPDCLQAQYLLKILGQVVYDELPSPKRKVSTDIGVVNVLEALKNKIGDCDTKSLILMSLIHRLGIDMPLHFEVVPEHAFLVYEPVGLKAENRKFMVNHFCLEMNSETNEPEFLPHESYAATRAKAGLYIYSQGVVDDTFATKHRQVVKSTLKTLSNPDSKLDTETRLKISYAALKHFPKSEFLRIDLNSLLLERFTETKDEKYLREMVINSKEAIKLGMKSDRLYGTYGQALLKQKKVKEVLEVLLPFTDANDRCPFTWQTIAKAYRSLNQGEAAEHAMKMKTRQSDTIQAEYLRAAVNFEDILSRYSFDPYSFAEDLKALKTLKQKNDQGGYKDLKQELLGQLETNIEKRPQNARLYLARAQLYQADGDLVKAVEEIDKALKIKPGDIVYATTKASFLYSTGKFADALIAADAAVKANPHVSDAYLWKAYCHLALKQNDQAEAAYKKAAQLDPFTKIYYLQDFYLITKQDDKFFALEDEMKAKGILSFVKAHRP